ncbi:hypothetical protein VOLCADRAFT_116759 [Volvox carteri f. nagariensis]|uniref:Uncharacterized protein n=1 Tax=Volvox carteri f. nagariensis TaxID=3068 RepID=D8TPA5_VOLCA|nr:uncharacterized protein VOLCADRAFT_116759 [Volvox carteri f. nagariensis]EFJ50725.1 hypothetical protein VOLCADRAFT_116759 [Volvox carteri f. nagariensis]|eukprot:XP_002948318.1 hypothetical protein VOLCADRAFT_116759 [Volvox carteri f. nagariensis]
MQDVRSPLPRRSSGIVAVEQSQPSHELPGTLRTNPLLYPGAVSPERRKLAGRLVGGTPHCPELQPRSPFTPQGAAMAGPWLPFTAVPLPPKLVFETWWHEKPQHRVNMHVTYDTLTRRCLAGTYVSLDMEVVTPSGRPVDEFDLHVGAEVRVAGRKVTLRKPLTLATQVWLDQQARAMLVAKYRIEQELDKFRPVVPVPAQYTEPKRAETLDFGSHQHMPAGGRINLRALYDTLLQLAEQLRQHRCRLPPLPDSVSERVVAAATSAAGPPDWSPERREAERREAEARQRELLELSVSVDDSDWRNDLTHWLDSIPLAASCCSRYAAASDGGKGGNKEHHQHHHHHHHHRGGGGGGGGGGGHRSGRHSAADVLAGTGAAGGGAGGGGGGGNGSTLAFNLSVINKLAAMTSVAAAAAGMAGNSGGGSGSGQMQSPVAAAAARLSAAGGTGGAPTPRPGAPPPMAAAAGAAVAVAVATRQR